MLTLISLFAWSPAQGQERHIPEDLANPIALTITGAGTGDRGCYISGTQATIEGTKSWDLMGEHGCEFSLMIGYTYWMTWREQNVLAGVCEGNIDCGLSDVEPFVADWQLVARPTPMACIADSESFSTSSCAEARADQALAELESVLEMTQYFLDANAEKTQALLASHERWLKDVNVELNRRCQTGEFDASNASGSTCMGIQREAMIRQCLVKIQSRFEAGGAGELCAGSVKHSQ